MFALALSGCTVAQVYLDSPLHRERQFYRNYRPPTEINKRAFDSSVNAQPERIQLINGEGFEYLSWNLQRKWMNYASYFVPGDILPFAAPARITSIEYFYCMLGDAPTLCGGKIIYESEELYEHKILSMIRKTNHEFIIDELIKQHGRYQKGENDTLVTTEEADGTIHRNLTMRDQARIWCDFSKGVPRKCKRSIVARFVPSIGRGTIIYMDEKMYASLQWFEKKLKHYHPGMNFIKAEQRSVRLTREEQTWWVGRLSRFSPHAFIPWEKLQTEMQLEAKARASGKPRPQIPRKRTQQEFQREWITAWVNFYGDRWRLEAAYWFGYLEAIVASEFNHQFQLTDETHQKWTALAGESAVNTYVIEAPLVSDGYIHGLDGIRNPPYGVSTYPNWSRHGLKCCEDTGMELLRKLGEP